MPAPVRRFWRSRLLQFSVRSLMIVTFLVAIACAWFLQPKSREESLAGGRLKLWRQVKYSNATPPIPLNHGRWTLSTRAGTVLCTGYYRDGERVGRWITYFPDGTKAAEGVLERNARVGIWRTWHANGQLETETTYSAHSDDGQQIAGRSLTKVQFSARGTVRSNQTFAPVSIRSGPTRAWHANGHLRYEGAFAYDREEGPWKYYDEQGTLVSHGPFHAGLRNGAWTFTQASGKPRTETYLAGRTQGEQTRLLSLLERKLHRRHEANRRWVAQELETLGSPGTAILIAALDSERPGVRTEAARSLTRTQSPWTKPQLEAALPKFRHVAQSTNQRERLYATAAIYALDESSRDGLFDSLWIEVQTLSAATSPRAAVDSPLAREIATILYRSDTRRRPEIFARLMELNLAGEPTAAAQAVYCLAELPGDILPLLAAHARRDNPQVRERVAAILGAMRGPTSYTYSPPDAARTQALVDRLKRDPDANVRLAAESADQVIYGRASGCFGVSSGGGFF